MTAAETGHLVLSTLHTNSASQTIDRIIDSFPAEQQGQVTSQLAATLVAIVSERLLPRISGGRIPAMEIMIVNPAIRNLIRERKTYQIDLVIETSLQEGMVTLNRSLVNLVKNKEITLENAELYSLNPAELRILLERTYMKFKYQAKTKEGEMQVGFVDAGSRDGAANILASHDLFILSVESAETIGIADRIIGRSEPRAAQGHDDLHAPARDALGGAASLEQRPEDPPRTDREQAFEGSGAPGLGGY